MNKYAIYQVDDIGNHLVVAQINSSNAKCAIKSFQKRLTSAGIYEVHKIKYGTWELSSSYGGYWYTEKIT